MQELAVTKIFVPNVVENGLSKNTPVRLERNNVSTVAKRVRVLPRVLVVLQRLGREWRDKKIPSLAPLTVPSPNGDGTELITLKNLGSSPSGTITCVGASV